MEEGILNSETGGPPLLQRQQLGSVLGEQLPLHLPWEAEG